MDTDDLSEEAYQAIMIAAEPSNHDLILQFGLQDLQEEVREARAEGGDIEFITEPE